MQSSNPTLGSDIFRNAGGVARGEATMTAQGAANKSLLMLVAIVLAAGWVWSQVLQTGGYAEAAILNGGKAQLFAVGGGILGLILAMVIIFKKTWAPILALPYAICEGVLIGGVTAAAETAFPGLPMQAAGITFAIFATILFLYKSRILKPTERFKSILSVSVIGIFAVYMLTMILGFFGIQIPLIHGSGPVGILFSLFVVGIASFSLVIDFEAIEMGAKQRAPKYMEWYGAFALTVTLVWLYMEVLRLLTKLNSRD